jgi:ParB-like chromosome segregation protein Spo0J
MQTKSIKLVDIRADAGTQSRARINEEAVAEYAERMEAGDKFPPVDVFHDGNEYYLADGFHRIFAANRNRLATFDCVIHKGTLKDAIWFSIGANTSNGVRRSPADKKCAIEIALSKFPDRTQEQIAGHVGCAQSYVHKVSRELITSDKLKAPPTRKGKDGKSRPTKYKAREKTTPSMEISETAAKREADVEPESPVYVEPPRVVAEPPQHIEIEVDSPGVALLKRNWRSVSEADRNQFLQCAIAQ